MAPRLKEGIEKHERMQGQTKEAFNKMFPSLKSHMEKKGLILPIDADEFLEWFIYVERPFLTPAEMMRKWPEITNEDFRRFAEYKEYLFQNGGKVGDLLDEIAAKKKRKRTYSSRTIAYYEYYRGDLLGLSKEDFKAAVNAVHKGKGGSVYNEIVLIKGNHTHRTQPKHIKDLRKAIVLMLENGTDGIFLDRAKADLSTALTRGKIKS